MLTERIASLADEGSRIREGSKRYVHPAEFVGAAIFMLLDRNVVQIRGTLIPVGISPLDGAP